MKTKDSLAGKIAVITGGSQGIGKGIAMKLASLGAKTLIVARNSAQINETVAEMKQLGYDAAGYGVDVSNTAEVQRFCDTVLAETGVDIYVNNAGITKVIPLLEMEQKDIEAIYNTNFFGAITFLQNVSKIMIQQNRGGSIILVTSVNGIRPLPSQALYSSTKAALQSIMESLAIELSEHKIRVNSIAPGAIKTAMAGELSDEFIEEVNQLIPLHRFGTSEEIGELAGFLATEQSSYVTGSTFVADGGLLLRKI